MIIVNSPGSWSYVYAPLRHAEWHGATPTDLIFPFFLFIIGVSISLSFHKIKVNFDKKIYIKIFVFFNKNKRIKHTNGINNNMPNVEKIFSDKDPWNRKKSTRLIFI